MRFPRVPKRSKEQQKLRADRAQNKATLSLQLGQNTTGNILEANTSTGTGGNLFKFNYLGSLIFTGSSSSLQLDTSGSSYINNGGSAGYMQLQSVNWSINTSGIFTGTSYYSYNADAAYVLNATDSCFMNSYYLYLDSGSNSYLYDDGAGFSNWTTSEEIDLIAPLVWLNASTTYLGQNSGTVYCYGNVTLLEKMTSSISTTTNAPVLQLSQTWNGSGVTFSMTTFNISDTASATDSKFVDYQVSGASKMSVDKRGVIQSTTPSQQIFQQANFGGF